MIETLSSVVQETKPLVTGNKEASINPLKETIENKVAETPILNLIDTIDNTSLECLKAQNETFHREWSNTAPIISDSGRKEFNLISGQDRDLLNNKELPSNSEIKVYDYDKNNFTVYNTDESSRVSEFIRPEIKIIPSENRYFDANQTSKTIACKDGEYDNYGNKLDDGGHLIANEFGGIPEQINLVPMESTTNRHGEWRLMEKDLEKAIANNQKISEFRGHCIYDDSSKRPSGFEVTYNVDGKPVSVYIDNPKGVI
ncbi:MAG: DNA/RNA non-specific endonuclease [Proteobacteria bacterium]|nr:DNA/RNA non-specific endonuclease [Pseudomonadota bacterium]